MSSVVPVFENVGERCTTKNYRPVILLVVVRKILEQLKNSRLADYIENVFWFLRISWFQVVSYGC